MRRRGSSGCPDSAEEAVDLPAQYASLMTEQIGRCQDGRGGRAVLAQAVRHPPQLVRDLLGAAGCLLNVARNLQYRRALLVHRR